MCTCVWGGGGGEKNRGTESGRNKTERERNKREYGFWKQTNLSSCPDANLSNHVTLENCQKMSSVQDWSKDYGRQCR